MGALGCLGFWFWFVCFVGGILGLFLLFCVCFVVLGFLYGCWVVFGLVVCLFVFVVYLFCVLFVYFAVMILGDWLVCFVCVWCGCFWVLVGVLVVVFLDVLI